MFHLDKYQIVIDKNKCIGCMNCVRVCPAIFSVSTYPSDKDIEIKPEQCINCGKCIKSCSTGAISYKDDAQFFLENLDNNNINIVCSSLIKNEFKNYKKFFGFLKQKGANLILDDSFGLEIAKKINPDNLSDSYIFSDMKKIIDYSKTFSLNLEKYFSISSNKAYLTALYLKKTQKISNPTILFTDSLSLLNGLKNPNEFFDYYATFAKINNFIAENGIDLNDYPEVDFDDLKTEDFLLDSYFKLEDFFKDNYVNNLVNLKIPSPRELQFVYKKLSKIKESQKRINCNSCGYRTCENFAIAMSNNIANENNCVFHLKIQKEIEKQKFENANNQMKTINDEITGLLKDSLKVAESSERNKRKIKKILDNLIDVVIVTDLSFAIQGTNMSFEKLLGYNEKEVIGSSISLLFPSHRFLFKDSFENSFELQNLSFVDSKTELPVMKKDGSLLECEIGMSYFELDNENSLVFIVRDISHRVEIQRMKDQFVSTVSHELRTPLTSIKGSLGLLSAGVLGTFSPKVKELISIAEANSIRLSKLINDILDLEKINAGKMDFNFEVIDICEIVAQSVDLNKLYAKQYDVAINDFNKVEGIFVNADKSRVIQVISNLISNAVKFSEPQGEIDIIVEKIDGNVKVSIKDYGIGIAKEAREKIFKSFSQVDSSDTRAKGGTGLGLSISKLLIDKMNGKIDFESEENKGSTFFFILPEVTQIKKSIMQND